MATAKRKATTSRPDSIPGAPAKTAKRGAGKTPALKRPAARRPAAKRAAAKRPAAKRPAAKRPAVKRPAVKRPAVKRPAVKRAAVKRAAVKRAAVKRAAAKAVKPITRPAKSATAARSRAPKTQATDASVLAFLDRVPDPAVRADCVALNALLSQVTGAPPRMWGASIVGFGQYRYRYSSGHEGDWPVCGYSPRKQNLTVYVMAGFERFPDIMARLGRYKTGKSCLYVNRLADIDAAVLRELVAASNAQLARMYG